MSGSSRCIECESHISRMKTRVPIVRMIKVHHLTLSVNDVHRRYLRKVEARILCRVEVVSSARDDANPELKIDSRVSFFIFRIVTLRRQHGISLWVPYFVWLVIFLAQYMDLSVLFSVGPLNPTNFIPNLHRYRELPCNACNA